MAQYLAGKRIVLGVTGSIAAYKSADIVRRLREAGAVVRVVMTERAKQFITPLTLQAVSGHPVHEDLFDLQAEAAMGHIELAKWADRVLIAPATAGFMARFAHGMADDLLTTLCLATRAPIVIAPAMNQAMWHHSLTQANYQVLLAHGVQCLGPDQGSQACGDVGLGRMLEPIEIVDALDACWAPKILAGLRVLVTAGPTHEALDPVRYLTNGSTGKMGYALAEAAAEAGAQVTLISGPTALANPAQVTRYSVVSAQAMYDAVMEHVPACDVLIAVAAVSDYRSEHISTQKIHKTDEPMQLTLVRNPDIVAKVGELDHKPYLVGFAAETENILASARQKRERKKMDMIIANEVSVGMGGDENTVTLITATEETVLPLAHKQILANKIIKKIAAILNHDQLKRDF